MPDRTVEAPHAARTYLERLPKTLRDELARSGRRGKNLVDAPSPEIQEALAREALTCGIRPKGDPLAYVIRRLRNGLGLCDYPSPPEMPEAELRFVDGKVREILDRLGVMRKAA